MALSKPAPSLVHQNLLVGAGYIWAKVPGISFSAGKSSLWSFQLFVLFCLSLYLFITELSVRRQNSLSGIFKLQESYKAGGSAS